MRIDRELSIVVRGADETGTVFEQIASKLDGLSEKALAFSRERQRLIAEEGEASRAAYGRDLEDAADFYDEMEAMDRGALHTRSDWTRREMEELLAETEQWTRFVADTFGSLADATGRMAADLMVDGAANAEVAIRRLAKAVVADLVSSLIRWAMHQQVLAALQRAEIVAMQGEIATVGLLTSAYWSLAAAKMAARFHASGAVPGPLGAVLHEGGPVRRRHLGSLGPDEAGPFVLQRGEYVIRREAAASVGRETLDRINRTGELPASGAASASAVTYEFRIQALDGADVERVVIDRIIPLLEHEKVSGRYDARQRG